MISWRRGNQTNSWWECNLECICNFTSFARCTLKTAWLHPWYCLMSVSDSLLRKILLRSSSRCWAGVSFISECVEGISLCPYNDLPALTRVTPLLLSSASFLNTIGLTTGAKWALIIMSCLSTSQFASFETNFEIVKSEGWDNEFRGMVGGFGMMHDAVFHWENSSWYRNLTPPNIISLKRNIFVTLLYHYYQYYIDRYSY